MGHISDWKDNGEALDGATTGCVGGGSIAGWTAVGRDVVGDAVGSVRVASGDVDVGCSIGQVVAGAVGWIVGCANGILDGKEVPVGLPVGNRLDIKLGGKVGGVVSALAGIGVRRSVGLGVN